MPGFQPDIPSMRSMTGYGRGERAVAGARVTVEVKSVNRRQAEVLVRLPRELDALESRVRDEVLKVVGRGRVEASVTLQAATVETATRINRTLAAAYHAELSELSKSLGITGTVSMEVLLRCPGVLDASSPETDVEGLWNVVATSLREALEGLDAMRKKEGEALAADLHLRIESMRLASKKIRLQIPEAGKRLREQLLSRIAAAGLSAVAADDERVIREVVFYADRSDISEELTRLDSHFAQYEESRPAVEPIGRKLDFLAQEMNREINTIGSKANDAVIAAEVVQLKTELERFREQVQNVE
jgi:uncharacterized protein (TIGR00255 family)